MKGARSIAGILGGLFMAMILISGVEVVNFIAFRPDNGKPLMEAMADVQKDKAAAKEWMASLPTAALAIVVVAWAVGAFVGGFTCALIAGRGQVLHAGIIGALILAATVFNEMNMKKEYDFTHPNWMILAGLLLPLPMSMLGGWLASPRTPQAPVSNP